jgi:hypothetical protein
MHAENFGETHPLPPGRERFGFSDSEANSQTGGRQAAGKGKVTIRRRRYRKQAARHKQRPGRPVAPRRAAEHNLSAATTNRATARAAATALNGRGKMNIGASSSAYLGRRWTVGRLFILKNRLIAKSLS